MPSTSVPISAGCFCVKHEKWDQQLLKSSHYKVGAAFFFFTNINASVAEHVETKFLCKLFREPGTSLHFALKAFVGFCFVSQNHQQSSWYKSLKSFTWKRRLILKHGTISTGKEYSKSVFYTWRKLLFLTPLQAYTKRYKLLSHEIYSACSCLKDASKVEVELQYKKVFLLKGVAEL